MFWGRACLGLFTLLGWGLGSKIQGFKCLRLSACACAEDSVGLIPAEGPITIPT